MDKIVLDVTRQILAGIKEKPYNTDMEQQLKQASAEQHARLIAAANRIKELENALESYEGEILKSIKGTSVFSQDVLAKLVNKTETELHSAKKNYAELKENATDDKDILKNIQKAYDEFKDWAAEFDVAPLACKRVIFNAMYSKIELGSGYVVKLHLNMSFAQFEKTITNEETISNESRAISAKSKFKSKT